MLCRGIRAASNAEGRPKGVTTLRSELALWSELAPLSEAGPLKEAPLTDAETDRPLPPPPTNDGCGLPGISLPLAGESSEGITFPTPLLVRRMMLLPPSRLSCVYRGGDGKSCEFV